MDKQVALAKSLLESKGYTVTKVTNESIGAKNISLDFFKKYMRPIQEVIDDIGGVDAYSSERGDTEELDIPCSLLGGNYNTVYTVDEGDEIYDREAPLRGKDVIDSFTSLDRKMKKRVELSDNRGYNILVGTPLGDFVYQNQSGYICLYKKF